MYIYGMLRTDPGCIDEIPSIIDNIFFTPLKTESKEPLYAGLRSLE